MKAISTQQLKKQYKPFLSVYTRLINGHVLWLSTDRFSSNGCIWVLQHYIIQEEQKHRVHSRLYRL